MWIKLDILQDQMANGIHYFADQDGFRVLQRNVQEIEPVIWGSYHPRFKKTNGSIDHVSIIQ